MTTPKKPKPPAVDLPQPAAPKPVEPELTKFLPSTTESSWAFRAKILKAIRVLGSMSAALSSLREFIVYSPAIDRINAEIESLQKTMLTALKESDNGSAKHN